jgi:hypothetical protein
VQVPVTPAQPLDVVDEEKYPRLQVHTAACAPLPAQLKPSPHNAHVPVAPAQPLDVVDADA